MEDEVQPVKHIRNGTLAAGALLLGAVTSMSAIAQTDPKVLKDLTSVIALQGKPCGQVTKATRKGENDYLATCSGGQRYHVFVDKSKRVTITPQ